MPMHALDIVLPCYNPQEGWTKAVEQSLQNIRSLLPGAAVRLIIVNDGSTKDIRKDLEQLQQNIRALIVEDYPANKGKGFAVRKGVEKATAEVVIYTDIDFPYEPDGLIAIYQSIQNNQSDIALAIREESYYEKVPAARRFISKLLKSVIRFTLQTPTADTQAGLKGFSQKGKEIFLKTTINRYLFDLEFIWLASKQKDIRIACIFTKLRQGIVFRKMHLSILFTEAVNFLRIFLRR